MNTETECCVLAQTRPSWVQSPFNGAPGDFLCSTRNLPLVAFRASRVTSPSMSVPSTLMCWIPATFPSKDNCDSKAPPAPDMLWCQSPSPPHPSASTLRTTALAIAVQFFPSINSSGNFLGSKSHWLPKLDGFMNQVSSSTRRRSERAGAGKKCTAQPQPGQPSVGFGENSCWSPMALLPEGFIAG